MVTNIGLADPVTTAPEEDFTLKNKTAEPPLKPGVNDMLAEAPADNVACTCVGASGTVTRTVVVVVVVVVNVIVLLTPGNETPNWLYATTV